MYPATGEKKEKSNWSPALPSRHPLQLRAPFRKTVAALSHRCAHPLRVLEKFLYTSSLHFLPLGFFLKVVNNILHNPNLPTILPAAQESFRRLVVAPPAIALQEGDHEPYADPLPRHKAQAKLSAEAQRPNQDLRKLVGSANLLDALILELADAEMEQESWFNQSVCAATNNQFTSSQERRVQWADTVVEEAEEDWEADDTASDSSSEESEEESMPPSPLTATLLSFTEKQHQQKTEDEAIGSSEMSFYSDGYYVPPRNPARLVSAMVH